MDVRFGVHAGLQHTSVPELQGLWRRIEELDFDWISVWDHLYAADATGDPDCLEAVATHTALAASTTRVRCGSLVYSAAFRHPAVLARAMVAIDQLSGGRAVLGMGAGWYRREYEAHGIPFGTPGERLAQLEESVRCVRALLDGEEVTFAGTHVTLEGARCAPGPVQTRLPIWIGGGGEQVTLRIAAQYGDGWNVPFVAPDVWAHKARVLDEHCERLGRDPATITKTVNVGMAFTDEQLRAQFGPLAERVRPSVLTGGVDRMVDHVRAYVDAGAEWVILAMRAPFDRDGLERFAAEVLPAARG